MPYQKTRLQRFRREALAAQGGLCYWCDMPVEEHNATAEHLVPRNAGGKTRKTNIVAACFGCNHRRGPSSDPPSDKLIRQHRVEYLRKRARVMSYEYDEIRGAKYNHRNFGRDPDGKKIWAPQFGIV